jgi:hypothetical protein
VAWTAPAATNPDLLVSFVVRLFEPQSVTDDRTLVTKWALPRQQFQWDLGHTGVALVFRLWQCDKQNHGWCESRWQRLLPGSTVWLAFTLFVK